MSVIAASITATAAIIVIVAIIVMAKILKASERVGANLVSDIFGAGELLRLRSSF